MLGLCFIAVWGKRWLPRTVLCCLGDAHVVREDVRAVAFEKVGNAPSIGQRA